MSGEWTFSWVWWITVVELPALGCLFWLVHHGRREAERSLLRVYGEIQGNLNAVLDNLGQSKLEVARLYATIADLKEVETRLTAHLLRLDERVTDALNHRTSGSCGRHHGNRDDSAEQRPDHGHDR